MWKKIKINKNQIEYETTSAFLIKMPSGSEYNNFLFWYPIKLIKEVGNNWNYQLIYNQNFKFNLKKFKGKEIKEEIEIDAEEIENIFETYIQRNVRKKIIIHKKEHIPKKIDREVVIDDELKR